MNKRDVGFNISLALTIRTAKAHARRRGPGDDAHIQISFEAWFEALSRSHVRSTSQHLPHRDFVRARSVYFQYFKKEMNKHERAPELASDDGPQEEGERRCP